MIESMLTLVVTLVLGVFLGWASEAQLPSVLSQVNVQPSYRRAHDAGSRLSGLPGHLVEHLDFVVREAGPNYSVSQFSPLSKDLTPQKGHNVPRNTAPNGNSHWNLRKRNVSSGQQHTLNHLDCPACEGFRLSLNHASDLSSEPFSSAAAEFLASRRGKLGEQTYKYYEKYVLDLSRFFGSMSLADVHAETLVAYQHFRQAEIRSSPQHIAARIKLHQDGDRPTDGASTINHEISCILRPLLKRAGLWEEVGKFYEPLPLPKDSPGIALTEEEESHLFEVAQRKPKYWMVAYQCSVIARNTTAGGKEIKQLRLRDVDLRAAAVHIPGTKTDSRPRTVPLNANAYAAAKFLVDRCVKMLTEAGIDPCPDHFLLPHRAHQRGAQPDPYRPMGSWKKAVDALRREVAKRYPRLATMRFYDWRHTACTVMLEDPTIPYATIEGFMGHKLGSKVKARYNHLRDQAMRRAAESLAGNFAAPIPSSKAARAELAAAAPKPQPKKAPQSISQSDLGTAAFWIRL